MQSETLLLQKVDYDDETGEPVTNLVGAECERDGRKGKIVNVVDAGTQTLTAHEEIEVEMELVTIEWE